MIDAPVGAFVPINRYQPGCQMCSLKVAPSEWSADGRYVDFHCVVTFLFFPSEATVAPEVLGDPD